MYSKKASLAFILYIKRLSTATFSLGVWVGKGEFTGKLGFFPIHGGSNDIKERHGFDKDGYSMSVHFFILVWFFKGIIQGIRKTIAAACNRKRESEVSR